MPTNQHQVEVVRFEATGLSEITSQVRGLADACDKTAQRGKGLADHLTTLRTTALGVGAGVAALGVGLARAGLQGSVEGARLEYAWTRLSRQLAAVAIPVVEKLSSAIGRVAGWFESLNGPQQAFLSKLAAIAVVAAPATYALKKLFAAGAAVWALGRAGLGLGVASGAAAVGGAAAGAAAGGAAAVRGGLMTAAMMNARGGLGLGLGEAAIAGGAAGLGSRLWGGLKWGLKRAPLIGAAVETGEEALNPDGFYERHRRKGRSRLESILRTGGNIGENMVRFGGLADDLRASGEMGAGLLRGGGDTKRRDINAMGFAQEEAGGAHFRIQEELLKVSVAKAEEETKAKEAEAAARMKVVDAMEREVELRDRMFDTLREFGLSRKEADSYAERFKNNAFARTVAMMMGSTE